MTIRDNAEALALLKTIDARALRNDIKLWLSKYLEGRDENTLSNKEMGEVFEAASPLVLDKYQIDIWDAMMMLNVAEQEGNRQKNDDFDSFDDWRNIYDAVFEISAKLKISPHLQDDYCGGNEFYVWCSLKEFVPLVSAIKQAKISCNYFFKVLVIEVDKEHQTGNEVAIEIEGKSAV